MNFSYDATCPLSVAMRFSVSQVKIHVPIDKTA
jgi:hypothetical protein